MVFYEDDENFRWENFRSLWAIDTKVQEDEDDDESNTDNVKNWVLERVNNWYTNMNKETQQVYIEDEVAEVKKEREERFYLMKLLDIKQPSYVQKPRVTNFIRRRKKFELQFSALKFG